MRTLSWQALAFAIAVTTAGCLAEREPISPSTGTRVRIALRASVQVSAAGERVVEIRARYRRVNGEQPTLPVQPTQVVIEDGATMEQLVVIDVGACNADASRVRDGDTEGCRFTIELTLKNGSGETLGSDSHDVGPVGTEPGTQASPTFVLSTPSLTLEPSSVDFAARAQQAIPAAQNVVVNSDNSNSPLGTLAVAIDYATGQGWLRATIDAGSHSVNVQPTTTALGIGTYRATVTVTSSVDGMKPQAFGVTYQVSEQPTLVVAGAGDGSGSVVSSPSGISCTISTGVTSGSCSAQFDPNTTVTLTAAPAGSDRFGGWGGSCSGQGSCVVTLVQSQTVIARFNEPAPVLQLSPTTLSFTGVTGGASPPRQSASIVNGGGGTLADVVVSSITYPNAPPSTWLDAFVSDNSVSVGVTPGNLPAGTYTGTISVASANGGTADLGVTIVVSPRPPILRLSPTTLSFAGVSGGSSPARQNVSVLNDGGGTLAGVAITDVRYGGSASGWLSPTVSGNTISVGADPSKLTAGTYTATVTVGSANGGTATFAVSFVVAPQPPRLALTPNELTFTLFLSSAGPQPQTVRASNSGSGTFADLGQLGVDRERTSSRLTVRIDGSTITIVPSFSGLSVGTYRVTAVITSARGGSATITVTLNVAVG